MKTQHKQNELNEMRKDPNNYRWGIFYFNPQDPRFFVPKRNIVLGWTLNFASPYTYMLVFMIAVLVIVIKKFLMRF
jgi:uncharacterized membrane protein